MRSIIFVATNHNFLIFINNNSITKNYLNQPFHNKITRCFMDSRGPRTKMILEINVPRDKFLNNFNESKSKIITTSYIINYSPMDCW